MVLQLQIFLRTFPSNRIFYRVLECIPTTDAELHSYHNSALFEMLHSTIFKIVWEVACITKTLEQNEISNWAQHLEYVHYQSSTATFEHYYFYAGLSSTICPHGCNESH